MPLKRQVVVGKYGRSPKRKDFRVKIHFNRKFFYLTLAAAALVAIFYLFFISSAFRIKGVNISGLETVNEGRVLDVVDNILDDKKFGFLDGANSFIFSKDSLRASMLTLFPKMGNVEIKISDNDVLNIIIEERDMAGVWCRARECFYFDKGGIIFEEAPQSLGSLMVAVTDERNIEPNLGSVVLEALQVSLAKEAYRLIGNNFSFGIKTIIITPEGEYEVLTSENWRILLDKSADLEHQLSNLKYLLDEEVKTRRKELEYVDLRLGNRVYYKYLEN